MPLSVTVRPGSIVGGDFRIVELLGKGGMGEVFVAEQLSTSKRRALKVMKPELVGDASLLARFEQEARVGARIESEHVVEVVAAGIDVGTGAPYLAMELLEGEPLDRAIQRTGPMPLADASEVFAQLGHGLAAAHRAGVVHRDLKPENVFIASSRQQGQRFKVKILDFGIAKLTAEAAHRTQMTMSLGTPRWMAPEQTGGAQMISCATDVWALGLIAYWMLTGRYYWKHAVGGPSDSVMTLMREVLFEPLVPASLRAREQGVAHLLPEGFDAWFASAVAREPSARFAEGGAAIAALLPLLARAASRPGSTGGYVTGPVARTGHHTDVFGETVARSLRRPTQGKSPWLAIVIAGLVGLVVIGGIAGVLLVQRYREREEELAREAKRERKARLEERKKREADEEDEDEAQEDPPIPIQPDPIAPSAVNLSGRWTISLGQNPGGASRYTGGAVFEPYGESHRIRWSMGHEGLAVQNAGVVGVVYGATSSAFDGSVLACAVRGGVIDCRTSSVRRRGALAAHTFQGPGGLSGSYSLVKSSDGRSGKLVLTRSGEVLTARLELSGWDGEAGVGIVRGDALVLGVSTTPGAVGVVAYEPAANLLTGTWLPPGGQLVGRETLSRL